MNIPVETLINIIMIVVGAIAGALWGHHGAIKDRVKYTDCKHNRETCPCVREIAEIQQKLK